MIIVPEDKLFADIKQSAEVHRAARNSLLKILRDRNFKTGVEIGVQYGQNAEKMLRNNVVDKLYGIDVYSTNVGTITPLNDKSRDNEVYGFALGKLHRFGKRYTHIKKLSNEAIFDIDGLIDCIYIDGGKSKEQIYDDITYWYPKVRRNGIIAGHDFNHSSYPYITNIVEDYFGQVNVEDGGIWWVEKKDIVNKNKISIVTPFYNASRYIPNLLNSTVHDERIDEIIIVDDFSDNDEYVNMRHYAQPTRADGDYGKVKVYRNEENLGEFKTRIRGAELATNDFVVFLDNDNYLTENYLSKVYAIPKWREDVIYSPDYGNHVHIDYRALDGNYVGKSNAKRFMANPYMFTMFLNTGNYLMNRKSYLDVAKPIQDIAKHSYGDIYFNGEWFDKGNSMFVVPGMEYFHTIRKDSAWKEHIDEMQPVINKVINSLK